MSFTYSYKTYSSNWIPESFENTNHYESLANVGYKPIDMYKLKKGSISIAKDTSELLTEAELDGKYWLPFCAEKYNISPKIEDYVIVPVTIMPSDLPNRNGIAFPHEELTGFNPDVGTLGYKTWKGKPTFVEHANSDYTVAKGVIFDSSYRRIKNTKNLWKVICLTGFDRNRDAELVNNILTNKDSSFSMGAYVGNYSCSICGALQSNGGCEHVTLGKPQYKTYSTTWGEKLAYLNAISPIGFETSYVGCGAFLSAINTPDQVIKMF